ncbi:MAG: transcription antitermination factor NusB, partial [Clostridia bacterium]|nr:transcription antitermination factor NusB [Clostridia bacterium]
MRKDAREVVFKSLYSEMFSGSGQELFPDLCREAGLNEAEVLFAADLLKKVDEHKESLDSAIGELARNYDVSRVYSTDKCALYIGLSEMMFSPDVPYIVAIDEALSLCKKYSSDAGVSFVNGIFAE